MKTADRIKLSALSKNFYHVNTTQQQICGFRSDTVKHFLCRKMFPLKFEAKAISKNNHAQEMDFVFLHPGENSHNG